MEPIKIEVNVTLELSDSVKNFLCSLFLQKAAAPAAEQKAAAPAAEQKAAAPAAEQKAAAPAVEQKANISIEKVREALSKKVNDHREAIKQKLNALGAPSITKMDPTHYEEMLTFLNSL